MDRTNLVGAALGATAILAQSLDTPLSAEGITVLLGKLIIGAFIGSWIARVVMRRFS